MASVESTVSAAPTSCSKTSSFQHSPCAKPCSTLPIYDSHLPQPERERKKVVEEVILELGLKECADTRIGNNIHKGCSGGEKRRTSIGVQLLSNPSVLFLDEPTTGLDATSAFQLVRTLKGLAGKGRTIITTIHQPRSEIWGLFDNCKSPLPHSSRVRIC